MSAGKKRIESTLLTPDLAKLNPEAGCLAKTPAKGVPVYALNVVARASLAAAIKAPAPTAKPEPAELISRTFVTFNCYACHERGKVGGLEEGTNAFFTTTEKEMGEEGRVPPFLDGVGAKMTKEYLQKIFGNGSKDRPYMHTCACRSMAWKTSASLVAALEAVDHLPVIPKVEYTEPIQKVKASGRHLVGGQALGCVKCHTFAGHKAEGVQGIDMTLLTHAFAATGSTPTCSTRRRCGRYRACRRPGRPGRARCQWCSAATRPSKSSRSGSTWATARRRRCPRV